MNDLKCNYFPLKITKSSPCQVINSSKEKELTHYHQNIAENITTLSYKVIPISKNALSV